MTGKRFRFSIPVVLDVEVGENEADPRKTARRLAREFMSSFLPMSVGSVEGFAEAKKAGTPKEVAR